MRVITIFAIASLVAGCKLELSQQLEQRRASSEISVASSSRFTVERLQVLDDDLAYNGQRGLYLITDTHTGQEFVGLSGVGISELGMHLSGKSSIQDER